MKKRRGPTAKKKAKPKPKPIMRHSHEGLAARPKRRPIMRHARES